MSAFHTFQKSYTYTTPSKSNNLSGSTYYTQERPSNKIFSPDEVRYTGSAEKQIDIQASQARYRADSQDNSRDHRQNHFGHMGGEQNTLELQKLLEVERKNVFNLETRLRECNRELERERRYRTELERENTELRNDARKKESVISNFENKMSSFQQKASTIGSENHGLNQEVTRLHEVFKTKLKEMEDKYKNDVKRFNEEIGNLKSQLKDKDIDNQAKLRGVSRELEARIRSLENQLREKDRIIDESEAEIRSLKEFNTNTRMEAEEELKRQGKIMKDEDRRKYEELIKKFEARIKELEEEYSPVKEKLPELEEDVGRKERMMKDMKGWYEEQLRALKRENIDLHDQLSEAHSEIERLQGELKGKDLPVARLQKEIENLNNELSRQKNKYSQEIERLNAKNEGDNERFKEREEQSRARIVELEKMVRTNEGETHKLKRELDIIKEQIHANNVIEHTFGELGSKNKNSKLAY